MSFTRPGFTLVSRLRAWVVGVFLHTQPARSLAKTLALPVDATTDNRSALSESKYEPSNLASTFSFAVVVQ